jgi:hypothetical protein
MLVAPAVDRVVAQEARRGDLDPDRAGALARDPGVGPGVVQVGVPQQRHGGGAQLPVARQHGQGDVQGGHEAAVGGVVGDSDLQMRVGLDGGLAPDQAAVVQLVHASAGSWTKATRSSPAPG